MFSGLIDELNIWSDNGKVAEFWWRDDDVQGPSEQLDQLLAISEKYQVALALAAIPDGVDVLLADRLSRHERVSVLQHGFSHRNFAPSSERKMELGWHRPGGEIQTQIESGKCGLHVIFGEQFIPVLVPPWNRIDARVVALLNKAGITGLSTLGPRKQYSPAKGLIEVNVHVDLINWKQGRSFAGAAACIEQIIKHLCAKREAHVDSDEPTGIMSHHLVQDAGCWDFLEQVFELLKSHESATIVDARSCFSPNNS